MNYEFLQEGSGWRLNISDLPANTPVMISFLCTVTEAANGMESINVANVQAQNAPVSQDDAEVYVNTAVSFLLRKVFRIHIWQPGTDVRKMNFG